MKIKDKLMISFDNIWRRKLIFAINTMLGIVAIVLLGMVLHMYNKTTYTNNEVSRLTVLDEDKIYLLSLGTSNFEENKTLRNRVIRLFEKINDCEAVEWSGTYIVDSFCIEEKRIGLEEIYKEYSPTGDRLGGMIYIDTYEDMQINRISMNISMLSATGVETPINVHNLKVTDEYIEVLVGSKLKDFYEIGKVYTYQKLDEEISIKIMGYLEEQSYFYQTDMLTSPPVSICLDGFIVFPEQYQYSEDILDTEFIYSMLIYSRNDNIEQELKTMAAEYNISIQLKSLEETMETTLEKDKDYQNVKLLMIVVFILTVIAYSTASIVGIIIRKNEIGIFYSCGFTTGNVIGMVAIENIIQLILVGVISLYVVYSKFIVENTYVQKTLDVETDIFFRYDIVAILSIILLVFVIVTVVPTMVLRRITVNSMIKDN